MKRQLCVSAFFALVLVPDWVSACWPPAAAPSYGRVYYSPAPRYYAPVVYCPPVVYLPPCAPVVAAPVAAAPLAPPRVEPSRPTAAAEPSPIRAPQVEAVRPAAGAEPTKAPKIDPPAARPDPAVAEKKPAPAELPKIVFPGLPGAKDPAAEPKLPPLVLPNEPTAPKLRGLGLPTTDEPKLPGLELPKGPDPLAPPDVPGAPAVPAPAPAPDALIPPPGVSVPRTPDALPPLSLPPDTPVSPGAKPTEAKSSPLTGGRAPRVSVFPAAGAPAAGARKVGFYNHTDRDLNLTIEGRPVNLPAKTYLHAQLPAAFTWTHGDQPARTETVPAGASGVDVLFR